MLRRLELALILCWCVERSACFVTVPKSSPSITQVGFVRPAVLIFAKDTAPNNEISPIRSPRTQLSVSLTPDQFDYAAPPRGSNRENEKRIAFPVEPASTVNLTLYRSLMEAQVLMLTTAVTLGAVMGGQEVIRSSLALIGNGSATTVLLLPTLASLGLAATTFLLIISFSDWTSRTSDRGASQIGFATSHLAHLLFGRQPALSTVADNDDEASRMTGTLVAVLSIGLLTLLTATCQEISFRGLLLSLISLKLGALGPSVISAAAAVGGQAVAYAAITTPWSTSSPCAADCLSLSFKLLAGLLLGALSLVSHSLYPCIAVQWLSSWYVLTNSWIQANHQMDWVEQQVSPAGSKSDAYTALPSEIRQSLFRFFCAFDSEQRSSLSISDVQRAVSFAFWHAESPPSQEQVLQLTLENYYNKKQDRMTMKPELQNWAENGEYNARLNFDEFLGVMLALRRQSKARWRSQNRTSETT